MFSLVASSCSRMISRPLAQQATSVATTTAGQQPGLSNKKTDTVTCFFYVLFISIIEHTEDDIYVPSLSANHPKIYLILSTLGYQKPVNHVCMYVCMYACMHAGRQAGRHACMHAT